MVKIFKLITTLMFIQVFFVTALVMLSYVLTRDLQVKISILEGMLFFYIVGDLLEELWSMVSIYYSINYSTCISIRSAYCRVHVIVIERKPHLHHALFINLQLHCTHNGIDHSCSTFL